jgi:hypothetical protein
MATALSDLQAAVAASLTGAAHPPLSCPPPSGRGAQDATLEAPEQGRGAAARGGSGWTRGEGSHDELHRIPCFFLAAPSFSLPLSHGGTHLAVERLVRRGLCRSPSKRAGWRPRDRTRWFRPLSRSQVRGRKREKRPPGRFPGPFQAPVQTA